MASDWTFYEKKSYLSCTNKDTEDTLCLNEGVISAEVKLLSPFIQRMCPTWYLEVSIFEIREVTMRSLRGYNTRGIHTVRNFVWFEEVIYSHSLNFNPSMDM